MRKSLLSAFTNTRSVPVKLAKGKISNEFCQGELTIKMFLLIFEDIASKLENKNLPNF